MTKVGINPVGAKVAIFGLTFKENCPDLRNTKVIDIIENLKMYNCNVVVTDSFAIKDEAKDIYNVTLTKLDKIKDLDAIILAVGHDDYKKIKVTDWEKILNKNCVFIDIKSIYSIDYFMDTTINHWRL